MTQWPVSCSLTWLYKEKVWTNILWMRVNKIPQYNQVREYDTMASIIPPHLAIRRERVVQVDPALRRAASITAAVQWILMSMPLWYLLI